MQTYSNFSFLATGDSYRGLSQRFRMGKPTIQEAINDTCDAIWHVMQPEFMPKPKKEDWQRIERDLHQCWNFPNCLGAVDDKHISVNKPPESGTLFHNYKGYFSIVPLALVDAKYKFIAVDVGEYGANTDSNVFRNSTWGEKFINNQLDMPGPKKLPDLHDEGLLPHVIIGDEAFPCLHNLLRPYPRYDNKTLAKPEAIFNYRLCHARMPVECAFGILAQRFCIFNRRIPLCTDNADKVVKAATVLHNYLREEKPVDQIYAELNPTRQAYLDDAGVACLYLPSLPGYRTSNEAQGVCDIFRYYFNSPQGRVPWQDNLVTNRREE